VWALCHSCLRWPTNKSIAEPFQGWIRRLEYRDERSAGHGRAKKVFGIVFVQNPYGSGEA
jgi:hypothetical protein